MSDADDFWGCVGAVIALALFVAAVAVALMALMTAGTAFGAGVAVRNYALAFRNNVAFERVTS